jgi:hypothetical protein
MEESVPDTPNELLFSFLGMALTARGAVAFIIAIAVSILIVCRMAAHASVTAAKKFAYGLLVNYFF